MESAADGVPPPRRYWAVACLSLGILMAVLDGSIANVALPTIVRALHTDPATSIWVVNSYQLVVALSLLPLAALGEIVGYRRLYRFGLAVFTLASLLCALSGSLPALIGARVVQGIGAACLMSVNVALLRFIWPRAMLGRGIGINSLVVALSAALGPSVAALILSLASWPWLFAVNVPLGLATLLTARALPKTARSLVPFDVRSALLTAGTFGLFILGLDGLGHGEGLGAVAAELAACVLLGWALVRRELSRPAPLLPIDLLRLRPFRMAVATSVCSFVAQMLAFVALPFYFQDIVGRGEAETGLLMTPWPLAVAFAAPLAGWLSDRRAPAGILGGVGLSLFAVGLAALALLPAHATAIDIVWRMAVCGVGFGLFQSPNNRAMLTAAPRERSGAASGMLGTARLLGQTSGAALVAVAFGWFPAWATHISLAVACAFAAGAAAVSLMRLRGGRAA